MTLRSLRLDEREACLDLWCRVFDEDPRAYFERYFDDPMWRPEDTVVAIDSGAIVSAVHVVRRTVETREGRRGLAGIANVATHPAHTGRGAATACLTELQARIDADPAFDFALLGTDIPGFYARLGWERWEVHGWEGVYRGGATGGALEPARPDDRDRIRAWYDTASAGRPLRVVRAAAYWDHWLDGAGWWVSADGYVRLRAGDAGALDVLERGGDPALDGPLAGARRVRLLDGSGPAEAAALLERPESSGDEGWMVRRVAGKPLPDLTGAWLLDADSF